MQEFHPADIDKDAKVGGFEAAQLVLVMGAGAVAFVVIMAGAVGFMQRSTVLWILALTLLLFAQVRFNLLRQIQRRVAYWLRPRHRRSDATIPASRDQTVQSLAQIQGVSGPFQFYPDGHISVVLRILPKSTTLLQERELRNLQVRWHQALKRAIGAKVSLVWYEALEPDLLRPEWGRKRYLAEKLPVGDGLRQLMLNRIAHHEALVRSGKGHRAVGYHLRLLIDHRHVPMAGTANPAETAMTYLRGVAMAVGKQLETAGARVQFLGEDGIRDLMVRQIDPTAWLRAEPPRGTDWAFPVDGEPALLQAPPSDADLPATPDAPTTDAAPADRPPVKTPAAPPVQSLADLLHLNPAPSAPPQDPHQAEAQMTMPAAPPPSDPLPPVTLVQPEAAPESPQWWKRGRQPAAPAGLAARPLATREVLAVVGATRRVGTSTVALNLALAFRARGNTASVILLDGGTNEIATWLGVDALVSSQDWIAAEDTLWLPSIRGLSLVPGPTRLPGAAYPPMPADAISRVVGQTHRQSDVVILDLGAQLDQEGRTALNHATGLIIVTTPDPDAERQALHRIEQAEVAGFDRDRMALVGNRVQEGYGRGIQPTVVLPEDRAVSKCTQHGLAVVVAEPESPWAQALTHWVQHIEEG